MHSVCSRQQSRYLLGLIRVVNPAVLLLGTYPYNSCPMAEIFALSMFIAALFSIGKHWNHPSCPSTDQVNG